MRITIWNEFQHEKESEIVAGIYPDGIHVALQRGLEGLGDFEITTATLDEPEHGLTEEVLNNTDVLVWWGHKAHDRVEWPIVDRVCQHVLAGMGLVVLHSGHASRPFMRLMGTNCSLKWREAAEKERLWNIAPAHPIMEGIGEFIELDKAEMYGERYDIPDPDQLLMISWFQGGEVFRSACTWQRGNGRVFYFRPGHETYPIFYNQEILRVIGNGCSWARRTVNESTFKFPNTEPLEKL